MALASFSFKCLHTQTFTYATPNFTTETLHLVTQVQLLLYNKCYSELTPYTPLAHSYWASFNDAYQCQGHTH